METLIDLFFGFAARGARPALIYRSGVRRRVLSYARLHDEALRMSALLASHGVGPGDRVLLWGPNSPWWGVAFWGCVARGAVVVPVDFMAGRERAATIAGLTEAKLVIQSRAKDEPLVDSPSLFQEDLPHLLSGLSPAQAVFEPEPDTVAELIYTSGTTGTPKGVVLTHANLMANLAQVNRHIPVVTGEYRFLSCLPLSHMFEQTGGFLVPLSRGASIVYLRTLKPSALMSALAGEEIHAVIAVPRLLQLLRNSIERELAGKGLGGAFESLGNLADRLPPAARRFLFTPVRRRFGRRFTLFVSGGAPLSVDLFRFWARMGFRVVEGYGLSECSPVLAANTFDRQVPGSVGLPLPGVRIEVRQGEIMAKGANIFPGYYRNEEATRQSFTDDGWFRTGDLGELDPDGFLHIRGRLKELIVTGAGVNVYPDEIEEVLNRLPGVRESCVIGLDRGSGEEVHAVLLPDGSGRQAAEIVMEANARLDELQRITGCTVWPDAEFPKTTTMKIQKFIVRKRLQEGEGKEPTGGGEDRLTGIIARVTGCQTQQVREDAFLVADLGLTSIARLELVNVLEQEYRLDLDDALIGPQTRVAELRDLLARRERPRRQQRFRPWVNSPPMRMVRRLCDMAIHFPLLTLFVDLEVRGAGQFKELKMPVLFIANHVSYLDQPVIMKTLSPLWRYRTATAVWAEFFFKNFRNLAQWAWKRFTYEYGTLALNLFPLPQSQGFRSSLQYMGQLVDRGVNLLVFPEGERSASGRLLPFQQGLGIMVTELEIPVVPVKIRGLERVYPRGARWPRRGRVSVTFGEPLRFGLESPEEIVARSRKAIDEL